MTTTDQSTTEPGTQATTRQLIALDIDGTLLGPDGKIPSSTVDALDLVHAAGHEIILATGRSVVGLIPVATRLGLVNGFAVCSNGSVTVRLDLSAPAGYVIERARRFDPGPVIYRALSLAPGTRVGVEDVGRGWRVNQGFEDGLLNGDQNVVPIKDLVATPSTRIALHAPQIGHHLDALRTTGVAVTSAGPSWVDVTAPGTSKATALEDLRTRLRIEPEATVAVGDGANDAAMLAWATRAVAMGNASDLLKAVADEVTGTVDEQGAVAVLRSLLPGGVETTSLSRLAAQLSTAVHAAPVPAVAIRVWHGAGVGITRCEAWTLQDGIWGRHAPVPAGTGATMRSIETAAREAGLTYPRGDEGRRRAHWRSTVPDHGPAGFELPLAR